VAGVARRMSLPAELRAGNHPGTFGGKNAKETGL
jgi:hypothetical protein